MSELPGGTILVSSSMRWPTARRRIPILKTGKERYVLGIVLEPETVDAQNDIYSTAEVREAAHKYVEEHRNVGLRHHEIINGQAKILESHLAPVDFEIDRTKVKKGTWLLAMQVLDEGLWRKLRTATSRAEHWWVRLSEIRSLDVLLGNDTECLESAT